MAPKTTKNADVEAANEIYQVARAQADQEMAALRGEMEIIRQESQAAGALNAITANITYNEMLRAITLQRVKQAKEYKKGGLTWDEFCDQAAGMPRRTVDLILEDLRPVIDSFSASFAGFCGMPFSKIRLLGKSISANLAGIESGAITYGGETIPITPDHADDIQALIERIDEDARKVKDEAVADLAAAERTLKGKEDVIKKYERDLAKLSKEAKKKGLTPEEDTYIKRMQVTRDAIDGFIGALNPEEPDTLPPGASARMIAALLETTGYLLRQVKIVHENAIGMYGDPDHDTDAIGWTPPPLREKAERPAACQECRSVAPGECADKCCNDCKPPCKKQVVCFKEQENLTD